uniref:Uncharacterized protein n=1 Tax=Anguilla anguilla TaxID=7936 RepID=A0A0E9PKI4_ANGAN
MVPLSLTVYGIMTDYCMFTLLHCTLKSIKAAATFTCIIWAVVCTEMQK